MTHQESTCAITWTLKHLGFTLYDDQKELWISECSIYSKKQWFDAVNDYYVNRKSGFKPLLQDVVKRIKGNVQRVEAEKYKPNPKLTYEDNYLLYLKWRFKE